MGQHTTACVVKNSTTTAPSSTATGSGDCPIAIDKIVSSNKNWAIKYSDGWIEQGGYKTVSSISAYGSVSVTFNSTIDGESVAFTSTPVYVHCTPVYTDTTTANFALYGVESVSSTGFTYRKCGSGTSLTGFYWVAKGI